MSRLPEVTLAFADREYLFRLRIGEVRELEDHCDAGVAVIMQRLATNTWRHTDIRETIRLGLIGGGLPPGQALKLTVRYVDERAFAENVLNALAVLQSRMYPFADEPTGKASAAMEPPVNAPPSPQSTD